MALARSSWEGWSSSIPAMRDSAPCLATSCWRLRRTNRLERGNEETDNAGEYGFKDAVLFDLKKGSTMRSSTRYFLSRLIFLGVCICSVAQGGGAPRHANTAS